MPNMPRPASSFSSPRHSHPASTSMGSKISLRRLVFVYCLSSLPTTATARSAAIDPTRIFGLRPRDDLQCVSDNYQKCEGDFPGNFCCLKSATCISVNNGKSAYCCPENVKNCGIISPVSCDIQTQNATEAPLSQFFSTDLTTTLQKCGDSCCPAGLSCTDDGKCELQEDAQASSSSTPESKTSSSGEPSTSTSSMTASSSSAASASTTTASSKTPTSTPTNTSSSQNIAATASCNLFPTPGLLVGFFSGLAAGVIATILIICCIGRKRSMKRDSADLSSVQASVSDPIYHPEGEASFRTDFLRRTSGHAKGNHRTSRASSKVKSLFTSSSGTKSSRMTAHSGSSPKTPKSATPRTPSMKKEPSMESIRIYSPPNIGSDRPTTQHTTFQQMMESAGFKEGQPYLGSPGRVDPRTRRLGEI